MMNIATTIVPIFSVIVLGWIAHRRGFIPAEFIVPANRIVYYLAIPAMIFKVVARTDFSSSFQGRVTVIAWLAMAATFAFSWGTGKLIQFRRGRLSTFIQSGYHCNIGYMALAVAYYYLGNEGLARTGMLAAFLMLLQNVLSVAVLSYYAREETGGQKWRRTVANIFGNPILLAAAAGMLFSLLRIPVPSVADRSLEILGGMALPMALILIGASLSFRMIRRHLWAILWSAGAVKLLLLPGLAYAAFRFLEIPGRDFLPAIILLASPTATVTYVMAREMGGDPDFAVGAVSAGTLLSAVTFSFWLSLSA
ncbi:MAG: AEC family transporter [Thermodesulfobacteriota bacterium]